MYWDHVGSDADCKAVSLTKLRQPLLTYYKQVVTHGASTTLQTCRTDSGDTGCQVEFRAWRLAPAHAGRACYGMDRCRAGAHRAAKRSMARSGIMRVHKRSHNLQPCLYSSRPSTGCRWAPLARGSPRAGPRCWCSTCGAPPPARWTRPWPRWTAPCRRGPLLPLCVRSMYAASSTCERRGLCCS